MATGSVLFTDLVGFTEYTDVHGDGAAVAVLDEQARVFGPLLADEAAGRLVKELGDGLLLFFDGARGEMGSGLRTALAMVSAAEVAHDRGHLPLRVRMGLHLGEVVDRGEDVVGHTVNLAARIAAMAGPGELLVTDDVVRACPAAAFRPIGPTRVRGVAEPVWVHRAWPV